MFREEAGTIDQCQALVARAKIWKLCAVGLFCCCSGLDDPTNDIVHICRRTDEDMNSKNNSLSDDINLKKCTKSESIF